MSLKNCIVSFQLRSTPCSIGGCLKEGQVLSTHASRHVLEQCSCIRKIYNPSMCTKLTSAEKQLRTQNRDLVQWDASHDTSIEEGGIRICQSAFLRAQRRRLQEHLTL
eukprot:211502-Amphidinium_carterae.1